MQRFLEKYTNDVLLKYYSLLTIEGRTLRRAFLAIIHEISAIDESTEMAQIAMLYETVYIKYSPKNLKTS